jgi:hypothetical protein
MGSVQKVSTVYYTSTNFDELYLINDSRIGYYQTAGTIFQNRNVTSNGNVDTQNVYSFQNSPNLLSINYAFTVSNQ